HQLTVGRNGLDTPGDHAQCLTGALPEPDVEQCRAAHFSDEEDDVQHGIGFHVTVYQVVGIRTDDELHEEAHDHPDGCHQEGIVEQGGESAQQTRAGTLSVAFADARDNSCLLRLIGLRVCCCLV